MHKKDKDYSAMEELWDDPMFSLGQKASSPKARGFTGIHWEGGRGHSRLHWKRSFVALGGTEASNQQCTDSFAVCKAARSICFSIASSRQLSTQGEGGVRDRLW